MNAINQIYIAYGSESGNAHALAQQLSQTDFLQAYSLTTSCLNDLDLQALTPQTLLLVITSSFGDGEPPANAENFLPQLANTNTLDFPYAVFGLGDTEYEKFCGFSQLIDEHLKQKGARPIIDAVAADLNYRAIFNAWLPLLQQALAAPASAPISHQLSVKVYNEKQVYLAEVLENEHLAQSEPAVYHLRLSLKESGIFYQAGDLLYVHSSHPQENLAPYEAWFASASANEILRNKELRLLSKNTLRDLNKVCNNPELKDLLKISNKKALENYLYGRDLLDVLQDFDAEKRLTLEDLETILSPLAPRAYSISSCGKSHPEYVDLCVRDISYTQNERQYQGTISSQLAKAKIGSNLCVFAKANPNFRLPEKLNAPLVMIGAGTGIAPFIGFLEHLSHQAAPVKSYLFFGERHREKDFLYQAQLETFQKQGALTQLFTAFSRDQAEKYYVQDALSAQASLIWQLIEEGAYFYICGSKAMSKAIDQSLLQIAENVGNEPYVDEFHNLIARLIAEERLFRDIY